MAHVVVLGLGTGGLPAAYEMRDALDKTHEVTAINAREDFQFVPSNPWVGVGWRKPEQISFSMRPYLERKGIVFIAQGAACIDPERNTIVLADRSGIDYDYLVIATGPQLDFGAVPGAGPANGHTQSICTLDHALQANEGYENLLEAPGPVIVGAMPGASCFGPAYEYSLILDTALRRKHRRDQVPMTYVTPEPYIGHMGLGGVGDSKGMLEHELRQRDIRWITNARVTEVTAETMKVAQFNEQREVIKEHELPFTYSMMIPAFKGVDAVASVEGLCNPRGFILVDQHQRNPAYPNIYAAGVAIAIPPLEDTPVPTGVPKTGYMIESMVTSIVQNIRDEVAGNAPAHVATWGAFCLADMGSTGAAFIAVPQNPPRNIAWSKKGRWVHYAKIAFEKYFLHKMKTGSSEPFYEKYILSLLGVKRLKQVS